MAYTAPKTWVTGEVVDAAGLNTYLRDNDLWVLTDSPCARAFNSAAFGTATATATNIPLNSERFDNASVHSTTSNTSRLTNPVGAGGKIIFGAQLEWQTNATGTRLALVILNGTTLIGGDSTLGTAGVAAITGAISAYSLAAGDYIEIQGYQDSGGGLNVLLHGNYSPEFWMFWQRT